MRPAVPGSGTAVLAVVPGVAVRKSCLLNIENLRSDTVRYGTTFFLGLTLGILCKANTSVRLVQKIAANANPSRRTQAGATRHGTQQHRTTAGERH